MDSGALQYLEIHIVDHCNLNCKGCSHFSPLSSKNFLNIIEFEKDLNQLKKHISSIDQLRLMGGEPLLHPELVDFLRIARKIYPNDRIAVVSNGILIPKLKRNVFLALKKFNIELHLTKYPTDKQNLESILVKLKRFSIEYYLLETDVFYRHIDIKNQRNKRDSFNICRKSYYCPALKNGELFQCSGLAYINILIDYFKIESISLPKGLNIYDSGINYKSIIEFLDSPDECCAHCYYRNSSYKWGLSNNEISEWIIK